MIVPLMEFLESVLLICPDLFLSLVSIWEVFGVGLWYWTRLSLGGFMESEFQKLLQLEHDSITHPTNNTQMQALLVLIVLLAVTNSAPYTKYLHNVDTGARCLDGSPSAIYVSPGESNFNILVFFTGGGYCGGSSLSEVLDNCYERSKTDRGSSKKYADTQDLDAFGVLSSDQQINPNFWNWTRVFIPYCDGAMFQGSRFNPISYKDTDLYFRGSNNTLVNFAYLNQTYGLYSASKVVIMGESAGGFATFMWSNYLLDQSLNKMVYAIPDSGLFVGNFRNPLTNQTFLSTSFQTLSKLVNAQTQMPLTACVKEVGNSLDCFDFGSVAKYQNAPMFIVQSQYDANSLQNIVGTKCLSKEDSTGAYSKEKCNDTENFFIDSYRAQLLDSLKNFTTAHKKVGIWAPACIQHGFCHVPAAFNGDQYKIPNSAGVTISESIRRFIDNPDSILNIHIDVVEWPNNQGCASYKPESIRNLQLIL